MSRHVVPFLMVVSASIATAESIEKELGDGARVAARGPSERRVRIPARAGGWKIDELFDHINEATGISILYDGGNYSFKQATVPLACDQVIEEEDLFDWLQAIVVRRRLLLVPVSPSSADAKQQWFLMDAADPNVKSRPVYVKAAEIDDYADRDDLYVVTTLTLRLTSDTTRMRNALAPYSTQAAGVGRIQDLPGSRGMIVGDYAPVAADMKRRIAMLDLAFALQDAVDAVVGVAPGLAVAPPALAAAPQRQ